MLYFSIEQKHIITQCNYNYSPEGIYHPDRVMKEYDFLLLIMVAGKLSRRIRPICSMREICLSLNPDYTILAARGARLRCATCIFIALRYLRTEIL